MGSHFSENDSKNSSTVGRKGKSRSRIVVISAPSGAGKTSIARALLKNHSQWCFSVSATTREKRPNEIEGKDYYFLTFDEFNGKVERGEMVEWEEIFGNYYGTLRSEVASLLTNEENVRILFDVDVKGALSIQKAFPEESLLVFIAPPNLPELRRRLMGRQTETEEAVDRRIERAAMEMEMQDQFDLIIVNHKIDVAVKEIEEFLGSNNIA